MEPTRDTDPAKFRGAEAETTGHRAYVPQVDIFETEDAVTVLADIPGVNPDDLRIEFEQGVLTLHGRVNERYPEPSRMLLHEYGVGDFHRSFRVDETIDAQKIQAEYDNGTLILRLPKSEAVLPRKIEVKVKE